MIKHEFRYGTCHHLWPCKCIGEDLVYCTDCKKFDVECVRELQYNPKLDRKEYVCVDHKHECEVAHV